MGVGCAMDMDGVVGLGIGDGPRLAQQCALMAMFQPCGITQTSIMIKAASSSQRVVWL